MSSRSLPRLNAALEDRYRIGSELGRGGMATVYLADDLKHERKVALKVFEPEQAAAIGPERFLLEIKTTANLQHPAILPLHDSGTADGFLYYVTPYVPGGSLRDRISRRGALPLEEVSQITVEIGGALSYAHASGVIHRDVKPGNILLSDGHAVLADFGISRAPRSEAADLTGTGGVGGTVRYMSPEQSRGEGAVGPQSDQYALACVVYEMLCGEPPFAGRTAWAVVANQMTGDVASVERSRPGLSPEIDAVLARALAPDPANRFADTAAFAEAVVQALGAAPAAGGLRKRSASSSSRWAMVGGLAMVLAVTMWMRSTPSPALDPDRVIVFPLADQRSGAADPADGEQVAIMVGASLEHAGPLRWIDGWDWLDPSIREDMASWSIRQGTAIARDRGARHVIDGRILSREDSVGVMLRLHDAESGDLIQTSIEMGPRDELLSLGQRAVVALLPSLIDPGGAPVRTDALQGFAPDVVIDWLRGEREYRESRFEEALASFNSAVQRDSTMALAAMRGALAARWVLENGQAESLIEVALANEESLSPRQQRLARGIQSYFLGSAAEAERILLEVTSRNPEWGDAWMALGEVYYHLVPAVGASTARAESAFRRAREHDPGFSPPLVHLAELAFGRGDVHRGDSLGDAFRGDGTESIFSTQLDLMSSCAKRGESATPWSSVSDTGHGLAVLYAGVHLAAGGAYPGCAIRAFEEMASWGMGLEDGDARKIPMEWSTLLGLQSLHLATGGYGEAARLISGARRFETQQDYLRVLSVLGRAMLPDAAPSRELDDDARDAVRRLESRSDYSATALWAMGTWYALQGEAERVSEFANAARGRVQTSAPDSVAVYGLLSDVLEAWATFARGDIDEAIVRFAALTSVTPPGGLQWTLWEPLAAERLALARLRMEAGDHEGVLQAAAALDQPQSIVYVAFVDESLRLRAQAAEALGRVERADTYRARLDRLRPDLR
jgi:tetratricopeptide (TPR) repeat protein